MINSNKVERLIAAERSLIKVMLRKTKVLIDLATEQHGPDALPEFQTMQTRITDRVEAFPAAVMARGPFRDIAALHAVLAEETRFVVAALDGGGH